MTLTGLREAIAPLEAFDRVAGLGAHQPIRRANVIAELVEERLRLVDERGIGRGRGIGCIRPVLRLLDLVALDGRLLGGPVRDGLLGGGERCGIELTLDLVAPFRRSWSPLLAARANH